MFLLSAEHTLYRPHFILRFPPLSDCIPLKINMKMGIAPCFDWKKEKLFDSFVHNMLHMLSEEVLSFVLLPSALPKKPVS